MKDTKDELEKILKIMKKVEEYKAVGEFAIEQITPYIDRYIDYSIDKKAQAVKRLMEKHRFNMDDAITLVLGK